MGWLNDIYVALFPERAYRREAFRQAYDMLRASYSYDAANPSDRRNVNWYAQNQSAEYTDRYSRDEIRARARDLERNSDIMNSVIGAFERNLVGGGYFAQAKTEDPELNKKIEKAWRKWRKSRNCDITGTQSLNQMMRMAVQRKKVDGGILFIKRYTRDGFVPFKLQTIEVDELDTGTVLPRYEGNTVVGGIEYNQYNKAVGYYIKQYTFDGVSLRDAVWIDASDVIFYFTKRRPSQLREMSDMAPTISRIRDINEFMVAVSVKQRIEACLAVFIKRTYPTTGLGRNNKAIGPDGRISYEGRTISPGMIKELNAGDEIQVVNPSGQGSDATSFAKLQQRLIGAGQGISYEATSRDMAEATYSSARQGLIEDGLTYKKDIELLMEVLDEIYETFIISAVLSGALDIKDFWQNIETYLSHEWIQEPKPWIDPQKESSANMTALQTGQKTYKQISAESGRDWRSQIDDIAEVLEYGKGKGVDMGGVIFGQTEKDDSSDNEVGGGRPSGDE